MPNFNPFSSPAIAPIVNPVQNQILDPINNGVSHMGGVWSKGSKGALGTASGDHIGAWWGHVNGKVAAKNAATAAGGGFPGDLINIIDPNTGGLKAPWVVSDKAFGDMGGTQLALDKLTNYANSQGPSPWLQLQNQQIAQDQNNYLNQANHAAQQNLQSSWDALASQGGLEGGAQERLASQNNLAKINAQQGIFNQGFNNRNTAALQDEAQKMSVLQSLPGMNLALAQAKTGVDQFNKQTALGGVQSYNQGIGAGATANAIGNSGKKGILG